MSKKIKLLILTDINVSNVHLMIASILNKFEQWDVSFLNIRIPKDYFDDSVWYEDGHNPVDISYVLDGKNIVSKLVKIKNIIDNFDLIFCTGAIANFMKWSKKPYIYFSFGSDLDQYSQYGCNIFEYISPNAAWLRKIMRPFKKFLYIKAIKNADITIIAPYQAKLLTKIGYNKIGFFPHPLEPIYLNNDLKTKELVSKKIQTEFNCEWIFFSATRHVWNPTLINENDYKGNDIIIRAFNKFVNNNPNNKSKLFFIAKGSDVQKSKSLVNEMNLNDKVVWLPPMNRKRLLEFYFGAHICFDQFSLGCLALCAIESMACGTPTVTYIGDIPEYMPYYQQAPPVFNSKDPDDISLYMEKIIFNPQFRKYIEMECLNWVKDNCSYDKVNNSFLDMMNVILTRDQTENNYYY